MARAEIAPVALSRIWVDLHTAVTFVSTLPLVTIAMPCLNEEAFIETCLESVRAQEYPADRLEILVADGSSTDRTREILRPAFGRQIRASRLSTIPIASRPRG